MSETENLLDDLRSDDWRVASQAAEELHCRPGPHVTAALIDALKASNTAVTEAATWSLLRRDDESAIEPFWKSLNELDDDITDHAWDVIAYTDLRETVIAKEMLRRDASSR